MTHAVGDIIYQFVSLGDVHQRLADISPRRLFLRIECDESHLDWVTQSLLALLTLLLQTLQQIQSRRPSLGGQQACLLLFCKGNLRRLRQTCSTSPSIPPYRIISC